MTFLEKISDPTTPMHWRGNMQADYLYTSGTAGGKFFQHLKNKDTFLATRCPKCKKVLFPPRLYCEDCFCEIPESEWIEVPAQGTVRYWTEVTIDSYGNTMKEPKIVAIIDIDGTEGAMLGIVKPKTDNKDLCGIKVKAVLKKKAMREGNLKDIMYFEEI